LDEVTGKPKNPNLDSYKVVIKDGTRLNDAQKVSAIASIEQCLKNDFPWTQPLKQYEGVEKYITEGFYFFFR